MSKKKLFLIDAFAIIYRSYFAFGNNQRYNSQGLNTSTMLGFTNTLLDVFKKENPSHIGVVFDSPGKTFREDLYPEYKANRDEMPEDIRLALPYVKKIVEAMNIPMIALEGFEADDIVGTIAKDAEKEGYEVFMMTPDKDYAQLVSENITLYRPGRGGKPAEKWGVNEVKEKFAVERPEQVIDILGLWGDAVDNIPGIPGIGEKTSKVLVQRYGSVEELIANAEADLKGKQRENVINFAEQGLLSKQLATIALDVPITIDYKGLEKSAFNKEDLLELFSELEFRGLAKRVFGEEEMPPPAPQNTNGQMDLFAVPGAEEAEVTTTIKSIEDYSKNYQLLDTAEKAIPVLESFTKAKEFSFDTETTGLDSHTADLLGISISNEVHKAYYISGEALSNDRVFNLIKTLLENPEILKIGQNIKYDMNILRNKGIHVSAPLFDTMIAHYLIEPDLKHNMDYLSETFLNYQPISIETLIGKKGKNQLNMKDVPLEQVAPYACEDADITFQLKEKFLPLLKENGTLQLFEEIEMPLVEVLSAMEFEGFSIDSAAMEAYSKELAEEIDGLEQKIKDLAGQDFNVSSPKQLGSILFDHLKIVEKAKKTKTGQYQTNEETLLKLKGTHEIIEPILDYRQLKKLKSTYVDVLPTLANKKTGKVHTSFNQAVAATGRLSSNNPNLQNIPIRTAKGREVRKAFIASKNRRILAADYSQVELRIMAEISKDQGMQEAFSKNQDIHAATAAKVFDVTIDEVDKGMRSKAKMVNFGIIYGISAFGLSQRLDIPRKEASEIIKNYFIKYPAVQAYMDEVVLNAKEKGYVETIMKRKRYLKDINSKNAVVRGYAERNAINAPIQGSAADIIKIAMINIHKRLVKEDLKSKMILQVHDELLFDVPAEEEEKLQELVKHEMENAVQMSVPLEVDMNFGSSWLEAH